jgi:hypothetical protein
MAILRTTLFLFFLLSTIYSSSYAQKGQVYYDTTQIFERAKKAVEDLHDGALIIRLPTEYKKLKELEKMMEDAEGKKSKLKYLTRRRNSILRQRDSLTNTLIDLFSRNYHFSSIYFLPDTAADAFMNGKREGIFWNTSHESDPGIRMTEESFVISRIGRTEVSSSTGIMAIIFQDSEALDLERPFPYYIRMFSLKNQFLSSLDNEAVVSRKELEPRIIRWNSRLNAFFAATRE